MNQQYKFGQMTLPAELIYVLPSGESLPLPRDFIKAAVDDAGVVAPVGDLAPNYLREAS